MWLYIFCSNDCCIIMQMEAKPVHPKLEIILNIKCFKTALKRGTLFGRIAWCPSGSDQAIYSE